MAGGCGFGLAIGIDLDMAMFVDRGREQVCLGQGGEVLVLLMEVTLTWQ